MSKEMFDIKIFYLTESVQSNIGMLSTKFSKMNKEIIKVQSFLT